jgi:hypothetical protein
MSTDLGDSTKKRGISDTRRVISWIIHSYNREQVYSSWCERGKGKAILPIEKVVYIAEATRMGAFIGRERLTSYGSLC